MVRSDRRMEAAPTLCRHETPQYGKTLVVGTLRAGGTHGAHHGQTNHPLNTGLELLRCLGRQQAFHGSIDHGQYGSCLSTLRWIKRNLAQLLTSAGNPGVPGFGHLDRNPLSFYKDHLDLLRFRTRLLDHDPGSVQSGSRSHGEN